ncbi:MAG: hypothetical protein DLM64_12175 [Solirubrobacterales bacterium]|nr:MAG: hypothetical protein DLM64_12175 [Solirubrobacterales bacterium]
MSVLVRSKRGQSIVHRRRHGASGHGQAAAGAAGEDAKAGAPRRRRPGEVGPLQDHAVYNCQCGYVFEAPVCTSVGCPHCGCTQAW